MPGNDGLTILEFEKNSELRFGLGRSELIFGARRGQTSSLRQGAARGGVRWKSQNRKKLCLSLLMSKNLKLRKVDKSFVPEPISSVFVFLYAYEHDERFMHVNILVVFLDHNILHSE